MRTNLSETDSSKIVSTIPLTASKGDANGDLSVSVLDVTTIISYLLNNNPQPFISEAADLNADGSINVLDVVGVVNLVLGKKSGVLPSTKQAHLYMLNDTLFADTPVPVGGIQFDISGVSSVEEIQNLGALEGFESGYSVNDYSLRLIYYSLSGKTIPVGNRIPLLKLKKGTGITSVVFGDKTGTSIQVDFIVSKDLNPIVNPTNAIAELGQNFPNPLDQQTIIPIRIFEPVDEAVIRVVNMIGQTVEIIRLTDPIVGEHLLPWNSATNKGFMIYTLEVRQGQKQLVCPARKMLVR